MNDHRNPCPSAGLLLSHICIMFAALGAISLALVSPPVQDALLPAAIMIFCARGFGRSRRRRVQGLLAVEAAAVIAGKTVSPIRKARAGRDTP